MLPFKVWYCMLTIFTVGSSPYSIAWSILSLCVFWRKGFASNFFLRASYLSNCALLLLGPAPVVIFCIVKSIS